MSNILYKIANAIKHPTLTFFRIKAIVIHFIYPYCSSKAIVLCPLKVTYKYLKLDDRVSILNGARIEGVSEYAGIKYNPLIMMGKNTSIQQNCHITCAKSVKIGDWCAITHNVTITDIDHSFKYDPSNYPPPISNKLIVNPVHIGNKCMIFANSVILGGSQIGNNCVIGANSVVRGVFPDNCVIVGSPATIAQRYNPDTAKWERTNPDGSFIEK